jgi:Cdc6-like AAA superfamily ATPase
MEGVDALLAVARRIRSMQDAGAVRSPKRYSDVQFVRRHPDLGSTKTYKRILNGDVNDLDVGRWLVKYRSVLEVLETTGDDQDEAERRLEELTTVNRVRMAVTEAMREKGNSRFVLVEGGSGSGKTEAIRALMDTYGRRVLLCEVDESWKESVPAMLRGILHQAFGVEPDMSASASSMFADLKGRLSASRTALVLDEAHHLGPKSLNMVKSIINQTPGEVIALAMHTLWEKLEKKSYEEARQLTQNRLSERVVFGHKPDAADVRMLLRDRLDADEALLKKVAGPLREQAAVHGHLNFVNLVCRRARRLAGDGAAVDVECIAEAMQQVIETR